MGSCAAFLYKDKKTPVTEIEVDNAISNVHCTRAFVKEKEEKQKKKIETGCSGKQNEKLAQIRFLQLYIKRYLIRKKRSKLLLQNKKTSNKVIQINANVICSPNICHKDDGLHGFKIPAMKPEIKQSLIFQRDPFLKLNSNRIARVGDSQNDPRDGPFDDERRRYPKIVEEDSSYEGDWRNGKRDGFGKLRWKDESTYVGEFEDDKVVGFGKLSHGDGDVYLGRWNDFKAEGYGLYSTKKGASYEGTWLDDRQHGYGREIWPRGSNYEGEYFEGNKQGVGILTLEENAGYKGEFFQGNLQGIGTFYFSDRRRYEGTWKNNKMHGFGIITWPDGKSFEGHFFEDKKEGFGVFYSNNKIYMGFWKNSRLEGEMILIEKGEIKKQYWENGKKIKNIPKDQQVIFEKVAECMLTSLNII